MAEKDLAYYFTLFKLKGHTTWRMTLEKHLPQHATERRKYRVDRVTGEVTEIK